MHIPSNLGKKSIYIIKKNLGIENNYFKTDEEILIDEYNQLMKKFSTYQCAIYEESDTEINTDNQINKIEIVSSKTYLKPKNLKLDNWLIRLKIAKYSFNLQGIPYDWIPNYGKHKIHIKALYSYLCSVERKIEKQRLVNYYELEVLKPPTTPPII